MVKKGNKQPPKTETPEVDTDDDEVRPRSTSRNSVRSASSSNASSTVSAISTKKWRDSLSEEKKAEVRAKNREAYRLKKEANLAAAAKKQPKDAKAKEEAQKVRLDDFKKTLARILPKKSVPQASISQEVTSVTNTPTRQSPRKPPTLLKTLISPKKVNVPLSRTSSTSSLPTQEEEITRNLPDNKRIPGEKQPAKRRKVMVPPASPKIPKRSSTPVPIAVRPPPPRIVILSNITIVSTPVTPQPVPMVVDEVQVPQMNIPQENIVETKAQVHSNLNIQQPHLDVTASTSKISSFPKRSAHVNLDAIEIDADDSWKKTKKGQELLKRLLDIPQLKRQSSQPSTSKTKNQYELPSSSSSENDEPTPKRVKTQHTIEVDEIQTTQNMLRTFGLEDFVAEDFFTNLRQMRTPPPPLAQPNRNIENIRLEDILGEEFLNLIRQIRLERPNTPPMVATPVIAAPAPPRDIQAELDAAMQQRLLQEAEQMLILDDRHNWRLQNNPQRLPTYLLAALRCNQPNQLSEFNSICEFCRAVHFEEERNSRHTFRECCECGKVRFDDIDNYPPRLLELFTQRSQFAKRFQRLSMQYNNALAFASIQCHDLHNPGFFPGAPGFLKIEGQLMHYVHNINPNNHDVWNPGRMYFIDGNAAHEERLRNDNQLDGHLLQELSDLINQVSPYAQAYANLRERAAEEGHQTMTLRFVTGPNRHLNPPTADEVAVIFDGNYVGDVSLYEVFNT